MIVEQPLLRLAEKLTSTFRQRSIARGATPLSHVVAMITLVQQTSSLNTSKESEHSLNSTRMSIAKLSIVILLAMLLTLICQTSFANPGAPNWLGHITPDQTLHVNTQHPNANDNNSGLKKTLPLRTITKAARLAMLNRKRGVSSEILIYPGTYRETIEMGLAERKDGPAIIMRARRDVTRKTIISGADIWGNWQKTQNNIYTHPWPYTWGLQPVPAIWSERVPIHPIIQRKEMIFVNGSPITQVLSLSDLRPKTFYVSEKTKTVYLSPPQGTTLANSIVEVATRSRLLTVSRIQNFVIQGLQFQHSATAIAQSAAVQISGSKNILIEDNRFVWNNWSGLGLSRVHNVTTRRNVMNRNGGIGWKGIWGKFLLSEHDTSSFNNWRGQKGNFFRWDAAGIKHLHMHDATYNNLTATNNLTRGFWLDTDNSDIVIKNACLCANLTDGLKIETSPGPIKVENSRICQNQEYGLMANTSQRILLRNNLFVNNAVYAIFITGKKVRTAMNWETIEKVDVRTQNWTMIGNVMFSDNKMLFALPNWDHFFNTLYSNDNVWNAKNTVKIFGLGREGNFLLLSLREWKRQLQKGKDSHTTIPKSFSQPTCQ
ncbi:MAG: hypothetical protein NPIRA01_05990 [Nitrospirales bacterium]|nr:MAG: hypothetical protein NPIRA01_05990 [Nitrospirales bacterium]